MRLVGWGAAAFGSFSFSYASPAAGQAVPVASGPGAPTSSGAFSSPPVGPRRPALRWKPAWSKFDTGDAALTGSAALGVAAFAVFGEPSPPDFRGPVAFDDGVRDAVRAKSPTARRNAEAVGDRLYQGSLLYPFLVDVLGVALIGRRASEVAGQMALINTEAFAVTGFLGFAANAGIRRQRPDQPGCSAGVPADFPGCRGQGGSDTFFSGRTSIVFTSAALTCAHHAYLPLYGESGVADAFVCAAMIAGATTAGVLRLAADQHYATDVVVGASVGLASGFLIPWSHYRRGGRLARDSGASRPTGGWMAMPLFSPSSAGLGASGAF